MLIDKRTLAGALAASLLLVVSGCATMFTPGIQAVPISSVPEGAEVFIDGEFAGTTPITIELSTNADHEVMIRFGSEVRTWTLARQVGAAGTAGFIGDGVLLLGGLGTAAFVGFLAAVGGEQGQPEIALLVIGTASVAPLVIDLAVNQYYELVPREIEAGFE